MPPLPPRRLRPWRCPQYVKTKWRQRALDVRGETGRYPRFVTLVQFIRRLAAEACDPVYGTEVRNRVTAPRSGSNFNTSAAMCNSDANTVSPLAYSSSGPGPCVLCNKGHRLFSCETFKGMAPRDRLNVVRQYRLCFNCLVSGHRAHKCSATPACTVLGCGRRHTRFIHGALYPIHTTNRSEAKRTEAKRSEPYCRIRTIHTSTECAAMRIPQFASFHTAHSRMRFVSHWKRSEAKRTIECCHG